MLKVLLLSLVYKGQRTYDQVICWGWGRGVIKHLKKMFYRKLQILKVYYLGKISREWA